MVSLEHFLVPKIKEVLKTLMGVNRVEKGTRVAWKGLSWAPNLNNEDSSGL